MGGFGRYRGLGLVAFGAATLLKSNVDCSKVPAIEHASGWRAAGAVLELAIIDCLVQCLVEVGKKQWKHWLED